MKCPYNKKSETTYQGWNQESNEEQAPTNGQTITQTIFELMECEKENCGAWHGGRCHYKDD